MHLRRQTAWPTALERAAVCQCGASAAAHVRVVLGVVMGWVRQRGEIVISKARRGCGREAIICAAPPPPPPLPPPGRPPAASPSPAPCASCLGEGRVKGVGEAVSEGEGVGVLSTSVRSSCLLASPKQGAAQGSRLAQGWVRSWLCARGLEAYACGTCSRRGMHSRAPVSAPTGRCTR